MMFPFLPAMLMPRITDLLATGVCREPRFAVAFVDATETARILCRNHLCGPAASHALGEALAAAALLGAELEPGATALLRMSVNGPLQGLCAEATLDDAGLALRGYPNRKVIDALDDECGDPRPGEIFGSAASAQVVFTGPANNVRHASFEARGEFDIDTVLMQYYAGSVQRPAVVHTAASLYGGYINFARAFAAFPIPGEAEPEDFESLQKQFLDGSLSENLDACLGLADLCDALKLPAPENVSTRPIHFHCGCSMERVVNMLARFSTNELESILNDNVAPSVFCHMCGRNHTVPLEKVRELIEMPF